MDYNEQNSSIVEVETRKLIKKSKVYSLCKVCGIEGALSHFGGLCCVSCKMFFRRNAQFNLDNHQCVFDEKCDITINSRRACRYCRLQKCLDIGMQRELLRSSHNQRKKSHEKKISLPNIISPNNLLSNDRSLLTSEQWCRLSNIINIYDVKSPVSHIRDLLSNNSKNPMKIRLKMAKTNILEIIMSLYQAVLPFVETLPEFQAMKVYDRCELIERNLSSVGGFNGIIVFRDAEVTLSTAFKNGFPSIYGSKIVDESITVAHRTENDITLIKLLIPIILFSTSFNVIIPNNGNSNYQIISTEINSIFFSTKHLFDIQNIYVEIMFKYMIYRFGYYEAALRFAALIKSFLDQSMCILRAEEIKIHDQLMQTIVKETETALIFQNEPMDSIIS